MGTPHERLNSKKNAIYINIYIYIYLFIYVTFKHISLSLSGRIMSDLFKWYKLWFSILPFQRDDSFNF